MQVENSVKNQFFWSYMMIMFISSQSQTNYAFQRLTKNSENKIVKLADHWPCISHDVHRSSYVTQPRSSHLQTPCTASSRKQTWPSWTPSLFASKEANRFIDMDQNIFSSIGINTVSAVNSHQYKLLFELLSWPLCVVLCILTKLKMSDKHIHKNSYANYYFAFYAFSIISSK